ncbi:MAG TPA: papain-like cysteine protease family protein [Pyrinomonadaceae bacterium]
MAINYRDVEAVGQYDGNACWAACLEWWLTATRLGNIYQEEVFEEYPLLRNSNGTIQREGLITLINDPRWYMSYEPFYVASQLTKSKLKRHLAAGPVYIGFFDQKLGNYHVNVIYGIKSGGGSNPQVSVMEPMGEKNSTDPEDRSFKGKHVKRHLKYYTAIGECFLGSPATASGSDGASHSYDDSY